MLCYEQVKDDARLLRCLTSLDQPEFEALLPAFALAWQAHLAQAEQKRTQPRRRKSGGGRKAQLSRLEDKLLFILVYFKLYPLQSVLGWMFGLSQGQANRWIHTLASVLQTALGSEQYLPAREPAHLEQVLADCDSLEFMLDGTERRRQRPKQAELQRTYYSGKKKAHTHKNNLIVNADSQQVVYLSQTVPGKTHDKKICDQEAYTFPAHAIVDKDTGFQGYEPDGVITFQPQKKPRGQELPWSAKFLNKLIAKIRITIEHVIAGVKRCRIVKDLFRNTKENFADLVMEIVCGLHNFRFAHRHPVLTLNLWDMLNEDYFQ